MPEVNLPLNTLKHRIRRSKHIITCQHEGCGMSMLPRFYESHCKEKHGMEPATECVWCKGNEFWDWGDKKKHANHLWKCFQDFCKGSFNNSPPSPTTTASPVSTTHSALLNSNKSFWQHEHRIKDLFGIVPASDDLLSEEHDYIWPLEAEPYPISFTDQSLNLAASYAQYFLHTRNTHDCYHIMVKAITFKNFVQMMNEDRGTSRTLRFSCWCNGGPHELAKHRQHRHLVVFAPKDHFKKKVWSKVHAYKEDLPGLPNYQCKGIVEVKDYSHFVNVLGYLTNRISTCVFDDPEEGPTQINHFYFIKTLPKKFKVALSVLTKGELYNFLFQTRFKHISIPEICRYPMQRVGSSWKQKIKYFVELERGLVLPVSKKWMPTEQVTPYYFHLIGNRKLYFECDQKYEEMDDETWISTQAELGNCFYDNVGEEFWTPRISDQAILNIYKPVLDRNKELETENASLKRKCEELDTD